MPLTGMRVLEHLELQCKLLGWEHIPSRNLVATFLHNDYRDICLCQSVANDYWDIHWHFILAKVSQMTIETSIVRMSWPSCHTTRQFAMASQLLTTTTQNVSKTFPIDFFRLCVNDAASRDSRVSFLSLNDVYLPTLVDRYDAIPFCVRRARPQHFNN